MIPISDDTPVRLRPVINWLLILACVVAYVWEVSLGKQMEAAVTVLGFEPDSLINREAAPSAVLGIPPVATIVTSMFLHGSILHLAGNMLYLWIFGNNIEDAMGHTRYTLFYFASGIAAALTMAYMDPTSVVPMIGASGAISGVLGAYILLFPRSHVTVIVSLGFLLLPLRIRAFWVVGIWFLIQLVTASLTDPTQPGVAWWAHIGGFVAGMIMTPVMKSSGVPYFGPRMSRGPWE